MASQSQRRFEFWNRRIHIYTGLYFLLFIWFFAFSGLLLNHPKWEFAQFWKDRQESSFERLVQVPDAGGDLDRAKAVMAQLDMAGEIERTALYPNENRFEFRVIRPSVHTDVKIDLETGQAAVSQVAVNVWGVLYRLHLFTGLRMDRPELARDWIATMMWSASMDALCVGLILMVLGGFYMWWMQAEKHKIGLAALGTGILICGFFMFGLRWVF